MTHPFTKPPPSIKALLSCTFKSPRNIVFPSFNKAPALYPLWTTSKVGKFSFRSVKM